MTNPFQVGRRRDRHAQTLAPLQEGVQETFEHDPSIGAIDPATLSALGGQAKEEIDTELKGKPGRIRLLGSTLDEIVRKATELDTAGKGALKEWAEEYRMQYRESNQTQWAYDSVHQVLEKALNAVNSSQPLTEKTAERSKRRLGGHGREIRREYRCRYIVAGKDQATEWNVKQMIALVDHLVKVAREKQHGISESHLSSWSGRLKVVLGNYLRSGDLTKSSIQVRYELERVDLLIRSGYELIVRQYESPLYKPEAILSRVEAWIV